MSEEKQPSLSGFTSNPKLYRKMAEPHASAEAMNGDLAAFFEELGKLREKYKLRDVFTAVQSSYLASNGDDEIDAAAHFGFGDSMKHEALLSFCLGQVQMERQEAMARYAKGALKANRERRG